MHRITQEIPRRAQVFGYGSVTLYGAAFQKLHLTFALPRRAPTTPDSFLHSALRSIATPLVRLLKQPLQRKGALCRAFGAANRSTNSKHMNESGLACSAFARHY